MPSVLYFTDYVYNHNSSFGEYIGYIGRKKARENEKNIIEREINSEIFEGYIDYINRSEAKNVHDNTNKNKSLFNINSDGLNKEERNKVIKDFNKAQENNAILWRDLFTFDNEWLEKEGYLNDGILNERAIKNATRETMKYIFDQEKLNENGFWVGEIHYNTDNIHVHVATTESKNTRPIIEIEKEDDNGNVYTTKEPKGKRSKKTLDKTKSYFVNTLVDRNKELERMSKLRYQLHHSIDISNRNKLVEEIYNQLPEDKSKWQYNRKEIKPLQEKIDMYTNSYIKNNYEKDYNEYIDMLDRQTELNKQLYGAGTKEFERYKDTKENKLKELNSKMGNEFLNQLKKMDMNDEKEKSKNKSSEQFNDQFKKNKSNDQSIYIKSINYHQLNKLVGRKYSMKPKKLTNILIKDFNFKRFSNILKNQKRKQELELEHQELENRIKQQQEQQQQEL